MVEICYNVPEEVEFTAFGKGQRMYSIGEYVVYGAHGVCCVADMEYQKRDGRNVQYYVLSPANSPGSRYLVPTDNVAALAKIHRLLTRQELDAILHSPVVRDCQWIADETERKNHYRNIVNTGDRTGMLQLMGSLYRHKQYQSDAGRKFRMGDETMLRDAEKWINSEISHILGVSVDAAREYVINALAEA